MSTTIDVDRITIFTASQSSDVRVDPLERQRQLVELLSIGTLLGSGVTEGNGAPPLDAPMSLTPGDLALMIGSLLSKVSELQNGATRADIKLTDLQKRDAHDKAVAQIQKMADKIAAAAKKEKALGILSVIGKVFGLIAAVAMTALTAGAASPLLVGMSAVLLTCTIIDTSLTVGNAISGAVGGPALTPEALLTKLAEACGQNHDEAAKFGQWLAFSLQMALAIASVATGVGVYRAGAAAASAAAASASATSTAVTAAEVAATAATTAATAAEASSAAATAAEAAAAALAALDASADTAVRAAAQAAAIAAEVAATEAATASAQAAATSTTLTLAAQSAAEAAAEAAELAATVAQFAGQLGYGATRTAEIGQAAANGIGGATMASQGGVGIAKGFDDRDVADSRATQLRAKAIMATLTAILDEALEQLKHLVERDSDADKQVVDLLRGAHESYMATAQSINVV